MDLSNCVCFNFRKAARLLAQHYDGHLQPSGLNNSQFSVLGMIARRGPTPITDIAYRQGVDRTTMSRNLRLAERRGYVRLLSSSADARILIAELTAQGQTALASAIPLWEKAQRSMIRSLGREHWDAMRVEIVQVAESAETQSMKSFGGRSTATRSRQDTGD